MQENKLYSALFLKSTSGIAMLFEENGDDLTIIGREQFALDGWKKLITQVDEAFYKLEEETGKYSDDLIIFTYAGVLENRSAMIPAELEATMKRLAHDLEFNLIGTIQAHEALERYYSKKQTTMFVELEPTNISFIFPRSGENTLLKVAVDELNEDTVKDHIVQAVHFYKREPKTLFMYAAQEGILLDVDAINWDELFEEEVTAVFLTSQEIIKILVRLFYEELKGTRSAAPAQAAAVVPAAAPVQPEQAKEEEEEMHEEEEERKEYEEDAEQEEQKGREEPPPVVPAAHHKSVLPPPAPGFKRAALIQEEEDYDEQPLATAKKRSFSLAFIKNTRFTLFSLAKLGTVGFIVAGLIFIVLALVAHEAFAHKLIVSVPAIETTLTKEFTFSSKDNPSLFRTISGQEEITDSIKTTGTTNVGEKAKGEGVVYNYTDKEVVFPKDTKLTHAGRIYNLQDALTVKASTTEASGPNKIIKPGEAKATIVASDIGEEYNIKKDSEFTINDDTKKDKYAAKATTDITGGKKEPATAVSQKDLDTLKKTILDNLAQKVQESKAGENEVQLVGLTTSKILSEKPSAKVGALAEELELTIKANITAYTYNTQLLNELVLAQLQTDEAAKGKTIKEVKLVEKQAKNEKGVITLVLEAVAVLLEEPDKEELKSRLVGNPLEPDGFTVKKHSRLFFMPNNAPLRKENIYVEVEK